MHETTPQAGGCCGERHLVIHHCDGVQDICFSPFKRCVAVGRGLGDNILRRFVFWRYSSFCPSLRLRDMSPCHRQWPFCTGPLSGWKKQGVGSPLCKHWLRILAWTWAWLRQIQARIPQHSPTPCLDLTRGLNLLQQCRVSKSRH